MKIQMNQPIERWLGETERECAIVLAYVLAWRPLSLFFLPF